MPNLTAAELEILLEDEIYVSIRCETSVDDLQLRLAKHDWNRLILGLRLLEEHERHHGPVAPGTGTVLAGPGGGTGLPGAEAG